MPHLVFVQQRTGKAVSKTPVYSPVGRSLSALDASEVGRFGGVEIGRKFHHSPSDDGGVGQSPSRRCGRPRRLASSGRLRQAFRRLRQGLAGYARPLAGSSRLRQAFRRLRQSPGDWQALAGSCRPKQAFMRLRQALAGSGRLQLAQTGSGRPLGVFGRLWEASPGSGRLWQAPTSFGRPLGGSGRPLAGSWRLQQVPAGSGRLSAGL